jgi:hypothetical protein
MFWELSDKNNSNNNNNNNSIQNEYDLNKKRWISKWRYCPYAYEF